MGASPRLFLLFSFFFPSFTFFAVESISLHRCRLCSRRCSNYYVSRWGLWVPALQGVITFFVVINFSLATFMDPGVIPKGMTFQDEFYSIYLHSELSYATDDRYGEIPVVPF